MTVLLLIQGGTKALALDSKRALTQYVHTTWGVDKGYGGGPFTRSHSRLMGTCGWERSVVLFASTEANSR